MAAGVDRVLGKVAAGRLAGRGSGWWTRPHIRTWINQEEQLGSETDHATQGSSTGK